MKCDKCGIDDNEMHSFTITPANWFIKILTFKSMKVNICQTCVSKIFRGFDKDK